MQRRLSIDISAVDVGLPFLDEGYHVECYATSIIKATPQAHEAVQAVLEKRKPDFGRRQ